MPNLPRRFVLGGLAALASPHWPRQTGLAAVAALQRLGELAG